MSKTTNLGTEAAATQLIQAPAQPVQSSAAAAMTASQRFTERVLKEYAGTASQGAAELNATQRRLVQGYFVVIDRALKAAEEERLRKNANNRDSKYNNELAYTWQNVNMTDLALDAIHYARMGFDMQEKNHLFPIPYANKKGGYYDVTFMKGYSGIQFEAEKFALIRPKSVTVELIYSNDTFKPIKKDIRNPVESYEFEITNPFDRGSVVGGFGYLEFSEPSRNTLVIMPLKAILKRKPKYASANFWGGKQKVWENGKQVEVETDGWFDEMCRKTVVREVYSSKYITRDSSKIDDNYQYMREREVVYAQMETEAEALECANTIPIDMPPVLLSGSTQLRESRDESTQNQPPAANEQTPESPMPPISMPVSVSARLDF